MRLNKVAFLPPKNDVRNHYEFNFSKITFYHFLYKFCRQVRLTLQFFIALPSLGEASFDECNEQH